MLLFLALSVCLISKYVYSMKVVKMRMKYVGQKMKYDGLRFTCCAVCRLFFTSNALTSVHL